MKTANRIVACSEIISAVNERIARYERELARAEVEPPTPLRDREIDWCKELMHDMQELIDEMRENTPGL